MLFKKLNSFALVVVALSPMIISVMQTNAFAIDEYTPAAPAAVPAPAPVAPPAPYEAKKPTDLKQSEILSVIRGFEPSIKDSKVKIAGLIPEGCINHIRIELDPPSDQNEHRYAMSVKHFDHQVSPGVVQKASDNCKAEVVAQCTTDNCIDLADTVSAKAIEARAKLGIAYLEKQVLDKDASFVLEQDLKASAGHSKKFEYEALLGPNNTQLEFKTAATLKKEADARAAKESQDELLAQCEHAEKGSNEDLLAFEATLNDMELMEDHENLFKEISKENFKTQLADLTKRLDAAEDKDDIESVIDDAIILGSEREDYKEDMKQFLATVAQKADELAADAENDKDGIALLKTAETALKGARSLDSKDKELWKLHKIAQLERFKRAAATGKDKDPFYSNTMRKEAESAYKEIARRFQNSRGRDGISGRLLQAYSQAVVQPTPVRVQTDFGPMIGGFSRGSLQASFLERSYEQDYMAKKEELELGLSGFNGMNGFHNFGLGNMGSGDSSFRN